MSLSADDAASLIGDQFPELAPVRATPIAEGGDHQTFEVNGSHIFRFPRTDATAAKMQLETALLERLAPQLAIPAPVFEYRGHPGPRFPHPFAGHRMLAGVSGELVRPGPRSQPPVTRQLGRFLSALHSYPSERALEAGTVAMSLPDAALVLQWLGDHEHAIRDLVPPDLRSAVDPYLTSRVALPSTADGGLVVTHHDLKGEHILLSPSGDLVTGIIDWTDICLVDPLTDFVGLSIWLGEPFVRLVLKSYQQPLPDGFVERLRFFARSGALEQLGLLASGESDAPLELLLRQLRWTFIE